MKLLKYLSVLIVLAFLLGACTPIPKVATGSSGGEAAETSVAATSADSDRVLNLARTNAIPDSFDPYQSYEGTPNLNDTLMRKKDDGTLTGLLAENWEISPDGKTYSFKLVKGVKFTDGSDLTSADVKYSLELGMSSPYAGFLFGGIDNVEAPDDHSIIIHMKKPDVTLMETLSIGMSGIVSKKFYEKAGDKYGKTVDMVLGSGPYILSDWKPGESYTFKANPDYFKGEPAIKKIHFKLLTDENTSVIALETGDIDALFTVPPLAIDKIKQNDKLVFGAAPGRDYYYFIMNTEKGPFTDLKLRKSIAYAVDRQKMLMIGAEGRGSLINQPGGIDYTANPGGVDWYPQDIEKAKALLKESGHEDLELVIKSFSYRGYPKLATALQEDLQKIGIKSTIQLMERNAFINDVLDKGEFDIAVIAYGSDNKDMDVLYSHLGSPYIGLMGNWSRYNNPAMDDILLKARGEVNFEKRKELYAQAIQIFHDDVVEIPLYYLDDNWAWTKDLDIKPEYINTLQTYSKLKWK